MSDEELVQGLLERMIVESKRYGAKIGLSAVKSMLEAFDVGGERAMREVAGYITEELQKDVKP